MLSKREPLLARSDLGAVLVQRKYQRDHLYPRGVPHPPKSMVSSRSWVLRWAPLASMTCLKLEDHHSLRAFYTGINQEVQGSNGKFDHSAFEILLYKVIPDKSLETSVHSCNPSDSALMPRLSWTGVLRELMLCCRHFATALPKAQNSQGLSGELPTTCCCFLRFNCHSKGRALSPWMIRLKAVLVAAWFRDLNTVVLVERAHAWNLKLYNTILSLCFMAVPYGRALHEGLMQLWQFTGEVSAFKIQPSWDWSSRKSPKRIEGWHDGMTWHDMARHPTFNTSARCWPCVARVSADSPLAGLSLCTQRAAIWFVSLLCLSAY